MWLVIQDAYPITDLGMVLALMNPKAEILPCLSGNVLVLLEHKPLVPDGIEIREMK